MPLNVGAAAPPGRAAENRTGSWRVFMPKFDPSACSKCGMCQLVCPEGCINETAEKEFVPDYDYCKGCGLCAEECPKKAITMEQEEK
jgi:pyruvate ferredoxin oxidoreductase delta subunit